MQPAGSRIAELGLLWICCKLGRSDTAVQGWGSALNLLEEDPDFTLNVFVHNTNVSLFPWIESLRET